MCNTLPRTSLIHFTPAVSKLLSEIEVELSLIKTAGAWPAAINLIRFDAAVGTIHYSNAIEGNPLPISDAVKAKEGSLDVLSDAERELVNYVDALEFMDQQLMKANFQITTDFILKLHKQVMKNLGKNEPQSRFKTKHEGKWRDGEAAVVNKITGKRYFGDPAAEVPSRMKGLTEWVDKASRQEENWPAPVLAAVFHYNMVRIHPFADGNGRTARIATVAILASRGYTPDRLFNLERYYAINRDAYFAAIRSVEENTGNQEEWVQYFLTGLLDEYRRIRETLGDLSKIASAHPELRPNKTQQKVLADFCLSQKTVFTRAEYVLSASDRSERSARNDIKELCKAGVIEKIGAGPSTQYKIKSFLTPDKPRKIKWNDERIEKELRNLIGNSNSYPTSKDFSDAGLKALQNAINGRAGGSTYWANKVGVSPPGRGPRSKKQNV